MDNQLIVYLIFGVTLLVSLLVDLGLMSRKGQVIGIRKALYQTLMWVCIEIGRAHV